MARPPWTADDIRALPPEDVAAALNECEQIVAGCRAEQAYLQGLYAALNTRVAQLVGRVTLLADTAPSTMRKH